MYLFFEIMTIGLILSADSFSAAIAMGTRKFTTRDVIKFASISGGAEALVAFIGATLGEKIVLHFSSVDHWIAFGILAFLSVSMGIEGVIELRKKEKESQADKEFHSLIKIIFISIATSMDAFGIGISLGIAQKPILPFVISIGAWAFIATVAGLYLAKKLSEKFGPVINLIGAIVLMILAIKMLEI